MANPFHDDIESRFRLLYLPPTKPTWNVLLISLLEPEEPGQGEGSFTYADRDEEFKG